jgi:hypothetical protein
VRIATLALTLSFFVGLSQAQFIPEKSFTLSSGSFNRFLAKGDFNRDGKLDVLVPGTNTSNQPELVVFPGNATGGFGTAIVTPITGVNNPQIDAAGDVNGDGIPDVLITGTDPITAVAEIGVMLADGTGKFKAPVFFRTSVAGLMVLGDFNGDGKADLAVLGAPVTVFPGKGDGTFGSPVTSTFNWGGNCGTVADFNKDGKLDLTTGDAVLLGKGDGTFQSPLTVVNGTCDVAVADFNKDGIPDLVTSDAKTAGQVRIFLGDGSGNFKNSTAYKGPFGGRAAGLGFAVDTFSGSTSQDIAVANSANNDLTMLLGKGDGTFTIGKTFAVSTYGILAGEFNGDLKPDLAVMTRFGFSVLLGKGDGTFTAEMAQNDQGGSGIHLADFNGDGKIDAIEFATFRFPAAVHLGNGNGTFGSAIPLPASCQAGPAVVADFNGDKRPDIAFVEGSGGGIGICLNNGDGTFKDAVVFDAGVQHTELVFGDFNHDGKLDLAASDVGGVSILLGNGDGTFKTAIPTAASNFTNLATGDFNHDGRLDLVAGSNNQEIIVLLGKGDGTFQAPITSPNPGGFGVAVGDLNKDGNLDLVTLGPGFPSGMNVLLGNGDGTFKAPTLVKLSVPETFQLRDVNGDGKLDLIVTSFGLLDVLLGNGDGTFQTAKNYPAPQGHVSLAAADLNGDGKLDVAYLTTTTSGPGSGTLTVYLNQGH